MRQKLIQRRLFREGVKQGYIHEWDYPNGKWKEQKISKRDWAINFVSSKKKTNQRRRTGKITPPIGFKVVWKIDAVQVAVKTGRGEYQTQMKGVKSILGFYDPKKGKWVKLEKPEIYDVIPINNPRLRKLNATGGVKMAKRKGKRRLSSKQRVYLAERRINLGISRGRSRTYRTKKGNLIRYRGNVKYYYSRKRKAWVRSKYQGKRRR